MVALTSPQALSRGVTRVPKAWNSGGCCQGWLQKSGRLIISESRRWFWQTSRKDSSRKIGNRLHRLWRPARATPAGRNFLAACSKLSQLPDSLWRKVCGCVWRRRLRTYYNRQQQLKQTWPLCFTVSCCMRWRILACPESFGHSLWRIYLGRLEIPCYQHQVWLWKARLFSRPAPCRFGGLGCHCSSWQPRGRHLANRYRNWPFHPSERNTTAFTRQAGTSSPWPTTAELRNYCCQSLLGTWTSSLEVSTRQNCTMWRRGPCNSPPLPQLPSLPIPNKILLLQ